MKEISFSLVMIILLACNNTKRSKSEIKEITYQNTIQKIVKRKCTFCHRGNNAPNGLVLTSYAEVRAVTERGVLMQRINDAENPMPKSGLMSEKNRDAFKKWMENGYKQ